MEEAKSSINDRHQRALVAYIRQEFEAPVGAILGFAEMILEDAEKHRRGSVLNDLRRLHQAAYKLKELVLGALDPARLQQDFPDFRRNLRHDLRSSISVINGLSEMLLEDVHDAQDKSLARDLDKLHQSGTRLLEQVDMLIDFTATASPLPAPGEPESPAVSTILNSVRPLTLAAPVGAGAGRILIVDDTQATRELLSRRLEREGHTIMEAENGRSALSRIAEEPFDLVLLDMMMPDINGYEVLTQLKADVRFRHIPVIILSAFDEIDSAVRCIEAGAEDYLTKPFNSVVLRARIGASLEKVRLREREQAAIIELRAEKERSEELLLNILPKSIIPRMHRGETPIAERFENVTILFSDVVGFTPLSMRRSASDVVVLLNGIFSAVDRLALKYGIEKIKTIGDAYMAVAGLPEPRDDHAEAIARLALEMREIVRDVSRHHGENLMMRIGIHTGNTVAGVIGMHKFAYDVWGDSVNTASAMESYGVPNEIQVSAASYLHLQDKFLLERRGAIEIKGKRRMETYFLRGERSHP
jgi:adenylate cyclase